MLEFFDIMRKVQGFFMHAMRPIIQEQGLTKTEMMILFAVHHKKAFRMTSLAKMADVPASTFTGIIDRLVSKNYIMRVNDPEDRRSVQLQGTPELVKIIDYMQKQMDCELQKMFEPVPPELMEQAASNLNSIYEIISSSKDFEHCDH
jgi:DNA-binding MarR family transcriptional regulator